MRRTSSTSDNDLETGSFGAFGKSIKTIGSAVGGHDLGLIAEGQRVQGFGGVLHGRPVGLAAHDDRDRFCRHEHPLDRHVAGPQKEGADYRNGLSTGKTTGLRYRRVNRDSRALRGSRATQYWAEQMPK